MFKYVPPKFSLRVNEGDKNTYVVDVPYNGKLQRRIVTVQKHIVDGAVKYNGFVVDENHKITGTWQWVPSKFANVLFISQVMVNECGQKKRYIGLRLCAFIRELVLDNHCTPAVAKAAA